MSEQRWIITTEKGSNKSYLFDGNGDPITYTDKDYADRVKWSLRSPVRSELYVEPYVEPADVPEAKVYPFIGGFCNEAMAKALGIIPDYTRLFPASAVAMAQAANYMYNRTNEVRESEVQEYLARGQKFLLEREKMKQERDDLRVLLEETKSELEKSTVRCMGYVEDIERLEADVVAWAMGGVEHTQDAETPHDGRLVYRQAYDCTVNDTRRGIHEYDIVGDDAVETTIRCLSDWGMEPGKRYSIEIREVAS